MTIEGNQGRLATRLTACVGVLLLAMSLAACKKAPNFTGKWASTGKTLQNGEQQKGILDLKQDGNQITGTVQDLGGKFPVKGTANAAHFELFGAEWNDPKPFLVADLKRTSRCRAKCGTTSSPPSRRPMRTKSNRRSTSSLPRCTRFPTTAWPKRRPWAGTAGTCSPKRWMTRPCAPWPTR